MPSSGSGDEPRRPRQRGERDAGAEADPGPRPRPCRSEAGPTRKPRYAIVVTDATALPRSASEAPRPAAPKSVGAATEIPAPPSAKPSERQRDAWRHGGEREPSRGRERAAASRRAVADARLEALAERAARDHGGGEEARAEPADGRGGVELVSRKRALQFSIPLSTMKATAQRPPRTASRREN